MTKNNPGNVSSAFEMLLEEIETEIDFLSRMGARAFENRAFDKVEEARNQAETITAFRDKVASIRKEWESISVSETEQEEELGAERRNLGRLSKGRRTPEAVFYLPILKALVELGGRGKLSAVLDIVHKTMKPILKEVDYQPLASDPEKPRWRNTAQWARNSMRQEGLIKTASPYGIWEITDAGRERLEQGR